MIEPEFPHKSIAEWLPAHPPGKQVLFYDDGRQWTYGELDDWAKRLAGFLGEKFQVSHGDRVAFLGPNDPAMIALLFACARIGAVLVPLNWRLTAAELGWIVKNAEPNVLIFDDEFADTAASASQDVCPLLNVDKLTAADGDGPPVAGVLDDPLLIVYTSGTTGRPKGAVLSQRALYVNALSSVDMHQLVPGDRVLVVLPLFHVGGLNISLTPALFTGAEIHLHRRFEPRATLDAVVRVRPDILVMVPATMTALMALPDWPEADLTSLRMLTTGSMIVPPELIAAWEARDVSVVVVYGSTETCPIAGYTRPGDGKTHPLSTGKAGIHGEIRIASGNGGEGEIEVRGGNVMTRYWKNEAETEAAFDSGWFRTGDIGYLTEDGHLVVCDRLKNLIISGGENIYPAEVERVINSVGGVRECCVVGMAHERWGETPVAVLVLTDGETPEKVTASLRSVLEEKLAHFKHPRTFHIVSALPRNAMGKVVAGEVRKQVDRLEKAR
ncbi:MAG: class I adenylate-forming enzyme family protein [Hyphomicrobiales bacterium]